MAELPSGIGTNDQATQVTAFIRQQPWYLDWLAKNGLTPGPDQQVKLSKQQRSDLAGLAVQNGIGLNHKFDQIDENGQVSEAHHKLKKTLIAAAIGGAALTGFGAAGIGPLAGMLGTSAAGAAGGGAAASGAAGAAPLASTVIGTGAIPAIAGGTGLAGAGAAGTAAATGGGLAGAISTGTKLAGLASSIGKNLGGGTPANAPQDAARAGQEQALTNNRFLQAARDQQGPAADAQSMRNMMRAAIISRMDPNAAPPSFQLNSGGTLALPSNAPSQTGVDFGKGFQDQLKARMDAGKSLTLSGVPDPSAEEQAAHDANLNAAGIGSGFNSGLTKVGNAINTGSRLAKLGMGAYDVYKGIF